MRANHHLRCVGLLHQLHNIVPRPHLIEKIIAKDLCNVDTYQRFTLLWHLSRDLELKSSTSPEHRRTFDICLLKMLDTLNMTGGPLKVLSQVRKSLKKLVKSHQIPFLISRFLTFFFQSWLVHAMTRGDVGRILEPLFLTLLDPCTARVSVLHCSLGTIHILRNHFIKDIQKCPEWSRNVHKYPKVSKNVKKWPEIG